MERGLLERTAMLTRKHALAFAVLLTACGTLGDRVDGADPPPGETWSNEVDGLSFHGARFADQPAFLFGSELKVTAVGGTQRIEIVAIGDGEVGSSTSFETADPAVATAVGRGSIGAIEGHDVGWTQLRVRGADGNLLDQTTINVARADELDVRPVPGECAVNRRCPDPGGPVALLADARTGLMLRLYGSGRRLVDSSARWSVDGERIGGTWDSASIGPELTAARASVPLRVETAGRTVDLELPVVDAVDELRIHEDDREIAESGALRPNVWTGVCADAFADGHWVPAAELLYSATPPLEVEMVGRCGYVRIPEPDAEGQLEIVGPGATLTLSFRAES